MAKIPTAPTVEALVTAPTVEAPTVEAPTVEAPVTTPTVKVPKVDVSGLPRVIQVKSTTGKIMEVSRGYYEKNSHKLELIN